MLAHVWVQFRAFRTPIKRRIRTNTGPVRHRIVHDHQNSTRFLFTRNRHQLVSNLTNSTHTFSIVFHTEKRTVVDARDFFSRTILAKSRSFGSNRRRIVGRQFRSFPNPHVCQPHQEKHDPRVAHAFFWGPAFQESRWQVKKDRSIDTNPDATRLIFGP